jgi:hypothetical protein
MRNGVRLHFAGTGSSALSRDKVKRIDVAWSYNRKVLSIQRRDHVRAKSLGRDYNGGINRTEG